MKSKFRNPTGEGKRREADDTGMGTREWFLGKLIPWSPFLCQLSVFSAVMFLALCTTCSAAAPPGMAVIPDGLYRPLFRNDKDAKELPVKSFALDLHPVTNMEFLEFVRANPRWRRSQVKRLFADENYLKHWSGDLEPGAAVTTNAPVTWVSWFAAKSFAQWAGKRLSTTAEWEYVAAASSTRPDGENDPEFKKQIAAWHSSPSPERLPPVGTGRANYFGVHDLHGLVWEWVADFNTAMVTGDARGDSGLERQLFCGSGSQGAKDVSDYAAFMRFGFRSSLKADYTVHNLGFRCAKDL